MSIESCNGIYVFRYQAQQICQGLQDFGWIEPLVNARESGFKDDVVLYIPGPVSNKNLYF